MFLKEMYPQQEHYQTEIDDYEHMCEKLAIYLLGYNIDVVYVYTTYMSDEDISKYHLFDEFFDGKIVDVDDVDSFVIK
jgi:hypothetical protein